MEIAIQLYTLMLALPVRTGTFCDGPVDIRLWDKVAAMRGKTHPEQAVALYKRLLPHVVTAGTHGAQYGEGFESVKVIQELRAAQKQDALFRQDSRSYERHGRPSGIS